MPKMEIDFKTYSLPPYYLRAKMLFVPLLMVISTLITLNGCSRKRITGSKNQWRWIDAIAEPDELVINVGDMLSRHNQQ
jgi:hypothetical protein